MFDEAVGYFNRVIEHDPENEAGFTEDAHLEIGNAYARQKNYEKALAHFNDLTMKFAGKELEKQAMFAIGDTYLRQEMYDTAHDQYQKIIKKFERDQVASDAMFRIGYIHRERGETANALAVYQDILEKFPGSEDTTYALRYIARLTDTTQTTGEE
jgi:TolA-binding protein